MYYYLIIAFQGFCIYQVIKNKSEYYWYFVILFLPVIGCIIYLLTQVYNKKDLNVVQNEVVSVLNPGKKIKDAQSQVAFADTFQNRVLLGDALFEANEYSSSIDEYEIALNDNYTQDTGVVKKLIEVYYQTKQYEKVIFCAEQIKNRQDFKGSRGQFLYGLALEKQGRSDEAEENLRLIDKRYSNYEERYALAQFLIKKDKKADAEEILMDIIVESDNMSKPNIRIYKNVVADVKKLVSTL